AGSPGDWPPARDAGGSGGAQPEAALTPLSYAGPAPVAPPSGRHAARQAAERPQPGPSQELVPWNADSIRLADRILAEADEQATMIVTTAQRAASEISRAAAEQAAAALTALTAAEQEAARVRESLAEMTAQLGRVAASVMESLASPVRPSGQPSAALGPADAPPPAPGGRSRPDPRPVPASAPGAARSRGRPTRPRAGRSAPGARRWPPW
ncbi:MAG TPA: hypothetical protein VIZ00_07420, partial [Streptosporangiaceae bacterium]